MTKIADFERTFNKCGECNENIIKQQMSRLADFVRDSNKFNKQQKCKKI